MALRTPHNSPFTGSREPRVFVSGGLGPYENTRRVLADIDLNVTKGLRVLLKPNAGRLATSASGITTHPEVVAAAIDAFVDAGAAVSVGESPITGVKAIEAMESCGIAAVVRDRGCPLLDMDARPHVELDIPDGRAVKRLKTCADVLEHDAVVSVAVMKTHMHTGVTLAVKNMKGCLWRRSKVDLHMIREEQPGGDKPLNVAIADMASVLRPHLAVIDGTVGMEGLGPGAGESKPVGVVVAGLDGFAADAVACGIMGFRAATVPHLRIGAERRYGVIDFEKIEVTPSDWRQWRRPFAPAPANISIKFPDVTILDRNSCSACQSTVLLLLKQHHEKLFDYFPKGTPVRIAIGKGHDHVPEGTLCIGNCTECHKDRGTFVSGCPPVGSAILKMLGEREMSQ